MPVDVFKDVEFFFAKNGLRYDGPPRMLPGGIADSLVMPALQLRKLNEAMQRRRKPGNLASLRAAHLVEELYEYMLACEQGNPVEAFDGLLDLIYVAAGNLQLHGFPADQGWERVHLANMRKVRASTDGGDSKRGSGFDVVKPPGWRPPFLKDLLQAATEGE